MVISLDPQSNHLLAALPEAERQRWLPQLEWVQMPLGEILYESNTTLTHLYFPTTAIVSAPGRSGWRRCSGRSSTRPRKSS